MTCEVHDNEINSQYAGLLVRPLYHKRLANKIGTNYDIVFIILIALKEKGLDII